MKASMEAMRLVFIGGGPYKARSIRYWANYWLHYNHLPVNHQGKHKKTIRLIDDEDIAEKCHTWIRSQEKNHWCGNCNTLVECAWLFFSIPKISYEKNMAKYEGENIEWTPPTLELNDKEGNGRSIMVNEFLSEECGQLKLNTQQHQENPSIPKEARTYLQPGKGREGFWTTFKSDALVVSRMNLKPRGKQPKMRDTIFGLNNQHQSMVNENGKPKGMKQILIERGL
ncbi:hypothetical protein C1645_815245 [Glomus cerebriforme]|uniref:Uncharacterized protein n=1 Tax=Glomus cerebriforme TaxID=658196 RepID=A0A397TNG2_9GLOM|nr:hypothetical protein C1645_815245 [Glomus cerebriforme]